MSDYTSAHALIREISLRKRVMDLWKYLCEWIIDRYERLAYPSNITAYDENTISSQFQGLAYAKLS